MYIECLKPLSPPSNRRKRRSTACARCPRLALSDKVSVADEYNRQSRFWIIATIVASLGIFVAFAAYTETIFGRGMNVRDVIQTTIKETLAQQPPHDTTEKKSP